MEWFALRPKLGLKPALQRALQISSPPCRGSLRFQNISTGAAVISPSHESQILPISEHTPRATRLEGLRTAKPFSDFLTDTFQRQHDYLRISLTEKCNLRCIYCMPEEGVPQSPPVELLTTPEIYLLSSIFVSQGVTKIRLTGGEPTVRRDILPLMHKIGSLRSQGLREICLTTNGISLHRKLDSMVEAGLTGVNMSLDTLDPWQFQIMTRRKGLDAVLKCIDRILEMNKLGAGIKLKINCVVMRGMNDQEILPFVEMGREKDIEVRFIEYMPFDGNKWSKGKMLGYQEMLEIIREKYPGVRKVQDHKNDTSKTFKIPGFVGKIGFITSMTHNFCGSCNRLRITSDGNLKVCLFGNAEVSLRDILRQSNNGEPIDDQAFKALKQIELNQQKGLYESKGVSPNEQELLKVIGMAVKGKKEKHAGMGELENMKNRPMILIDKKISSQPHALINTKSFSLLRKPMIWSQPWTKIPSYLLQSNSAYSSHISTRLFSTSKASPPPSKNTSSSPKLTHLTPSGSAHMVPISHKQATSRTAIAVCSVHFTSSLPIQLIQENSNKKGDVLGVARIAGIMAAKKTSDLVPLCHPIAISHVSVELEIGQSTTETRISSRNENNAEESKVSRPWAGTGQGDAYSWNSSSSKESDSSHSTENSPINILSHEKPTPKENSIINITATVSCDGKTGVEMEALTAASVAALTVYDMCKAVDKGMRIEGLRVIRKEGGKSGTWILD